MVVVDRGVGVPIGMGDGGWAEQAGEMGLSRTAPPLFYVRWLVASLCSWTKKAPAW